MAFGRPSDWTDERTAELRKLWAEGLSAREIAKRLGQVTRNAVIGKVHRLELPPRATLDRGVAAKTPRRRPLRQRPKLYNKIEARFPPTALPGPDALAPIDPTLTTARLNAFTCRYPLGDPHQADFSYCGRPSCDAPYCAHHMRIAYMPGSSKPRGIEDAVRAEVRRMYWAAEL